MALTLEDKVDKLERAVQNLSNQDKFAGVSKELNDLKSNMGIHEECIRNHSQFLKDQDDLTKKHEASIEQIQQVIAPVNFVEKAFGKVGVITSKVVTVITTGMASTIKSIFPYVLCIVLGFGVATHQSGCNWVNPFVPPNPTPKPIPDPVPPLPPPTPAPIPGKGLRVLVVYDKSTLKDEQEGIVYGQTVREYLNSKCVVGEDGKTPDRRIYANGVDVSGEAKWIQNAFQQHPGKTSWMVISDGKTGYDGDIPANADEAMKLLKKYGEVR